MHFEVAMGPRTHRFCGYVKSLVKKGLRNTLEEPTLKSEVYRVQEPETFPEVIQLWRAGIATAYSVWALQDPLALVRVPLALAYATMGWFAKQDCFKIPFARVHHLPPRQRSEPSLRLINSRPLATAMPSHAGAASSLISAVFFPVSAETAHKTPPIRPS